MKSDLLQVVAICSHGNAYLASGDERYLAPLSNHSTLKSVYGVAFERDGLRGNKELVGEALGPFLRRISREGIDRLRPWLDNYRGQPPGWGFLADSDRGLTLWSPTWKKRVKGYDDPTPYKVTYQAEKRNRWSVRMPVAIEATETGFKEALDHALDVLPETPIRAIFERCIQLHEQKSPQILVGQDVISSCTPEQGVALYASAVRILLVLESGDWKAALESSPAVRSAGEHLWIALGSSLEVVAGLSEHAAQPEEQPKVG